MSRTSATTILRWGLAFVFFYAAVASMIDPAAWSIYSPSILRGFMSDRIFFVIFGVYQLFLAGWLFVGKRIATAAIVSLATFVAIIAVNFFSFDTVFADVGLAMASFALFEIVHQRI